MRRFFLRSLIGVAVASASIASAASAREITFEDRVAAQKAIEQVYWNHRMWPADNLTPKPPLSEAMQDDVITGRVRFYLLASKAMDTVFHRPITAGQLQAELDRMASHTRDPQLLHELFDALNNDPALIAETLARQSLADNLLREQHARTVGGSFDAWWSSRRAGLQVRVEIPRGDYVLPTIAAVAATPGALPSARQGHTVVWTGQNMIVWGGESLTNTGGIYDSAIDVWFAISTGAGVPSGRGRHTAVWTGAEMIVWGGLTAGGETDTGARYSPATDSWTATSTGANVPSSRQRHTAVWTGSRMIVFGGSAGASYFNTGGAYDPSSDSWTATSTVGAGVPTPREQHTAVWTGTQMIVWGGNDSVGRLNTGSRYTPSSDSWVATSAVGAPVARNRHTAVWTGSQMIVWGGFGGTYLNTGGRYNPTLGTWSATAGGPTARASHTAVWTGNEMLIWGGQGPTGAVDTGSRYNFAANTWTAIASGGGSPVARYGHTAVWNGMELIVWGGFNGTSVLDTGSRLNTQAGTWRSTITSIPAIAIQPRSQTAPIGGSVTFGTTAGGDAVLAYQWRRNGVAVTDGPRISGATTNCLTISKVVSTDAGDYSVVVTNGNGNAISADAALTVVAPQAGDVDPSFLRNARLNGQPFTAVAQTDGKVLVTAPFGGAPGIVRLKPDGTTDRSFMTGLAGPNAQVYDMEVQPDGKILVVGRFTAINGVTRNRLARLNPDGTLDAGFQNGMQGEGNLEPVTSVTVVPDGKVIVTGGFHTMNGVSGWNGIARLNPDGSNDNTFAHGSGTGVSFGWVDNVALQTDGKLIIAGAFSMVGGLARNGIARLNADGTTDTTFQNGMAGVDDEVHGIAVQPDGRVVIVGFFTHVNGASRSYLARLNTDGSLDGAFLPEPDLNPWRVIAQGDGKILIGGYFSNVAGVPRVGIARLNADGSADTTFQEGMAGAYGVTALARTATGLVVIGGDFETVNGVSRRRIARLTDDGNLDATFAPPESGIDGGVSTLVAEPTGRWLIAGNFTNVDGVDGGIARLNPDGSFDPSFHAPTVGAATVLRQPDGRWLVGGSFTEIEGVSYRCVARLMPDGALDPSFTDPAVGGNSPSVSLLALQPDGRVLIAGIFTSVGGSPRGHVARLNSDGTLDTSFGDGLAGADGFVSAIALQPDDKLVIAGDFTTVNGVPRGGAARLNPDGTIDPVFMNAGPPLVDSDVIAIQADGKVLFGLDSLSGTGINRRNATDGTRDVGFMSGLAGFVNVPNSYYWKVTSLFPYPDGRILVGGNFVSANGTPRFGIARLMPDGSLDSTFQNGMTGANGSVTSLGVQQDGRVLIGGEFSSVNGVPRGSVARLYGEAPVAPAVSTNPSNQVSHEASCAVFHVVATGTPLDYQWRRGGIDLVDGPNVSGSQSSTLTLTNVSVGDIGNYDCVVTNVLSQVTTIQASLSIAPTPQCQVATCDPVLGSVLVPTPAPGEVASVQINGQVSTNLTWTDLGGGALYDVASSTLADLRSGGIAGATCLANDVSGASYADTQPSPGSGQAYYYIVRGQSACGTGGYGTDSAGVPRVPAAACP